jgi:tetratricopeptide (TPR) repeat protein
MVSQSQSAQNPRSFKQIREDAVEHALAGRWQEAAEANVEGLEIDPNDVSCLNRLAKAYLELSRYKDARSLLEKAVSIDPLNRVADRQLDRLKKLGGSNIARRTSGGTATSSALFISDPAVATVSGLKKVAAPDALAAVSPGDKFKLEIDESIITVKTRGGDYVGTLEVRIATRLRKLIDGGNKYEVLAAKLTDSEVIVVVRETKRSQAQSRVASFPSYLQSKIGDFDIDDPMDINDEIRMEDDMDEFAPAPLEDESIMRGEFGGSPDDSSLKF